MIFEFEVNMRLYNIGITEDTELVIDGGEVDEYKWRPYLRTGNDGCAVVIEDVDFDIDAYIDEDTIEFLQENGQYDTFIEAIEHLKQSHKTQESVIINWGVEYDNNIGIIFGDKEKILEWLSRPYDESEYPD